MFIKTHDVLNLTRSQDVSKGDEDEPGKEKWTMKIKEVVMTTQNYLFEVNWRSWYFLATRSSFCRTVAEKFIS